MPRRPTDRTLKYVVAWLHANGLAIYGPCVRFELEVQQPGNLDYDAEMVLKLIKLNKKYPDGIPMDSFEED